MSEVVFEFDEVKAELEAVASLAGTQFLERGASDRLLLAANDLLRLKRIKGIGIWEVNQNQAVTTTSSRRYHRSGRGQHDVYAKIAWTWTLMMKKQNSKEFALRDLTSTRVDVMRRLPGGDEPLLSWVMDIGDAGGPGAHFHMQVKNIPPPDRGVSEFDVPRIPSIFVTPAEQLDFVLGELFQEDWPRRQGEFFNEQQYGNVREIQQRRLGSFLQELCDVVKGGGRDRSGWLTLKQWKPKNLRLTGRPR